MQRSLPTIIEFTGPSGAGKTTLSSCVIKQLKKDGYNVAVVHECEENNCPLLPKYFSNSSQHNWKTDCMVLPWMLLFFFQHPRFFFFAIKIILFNKGLRLHRISIVRSFIRKAGIYSFVNRPKFSGWIIVFDEGLFHSSHNFLVAPVDFWNVKLANKFSQLVPLPSLLILLLVDVSVLIQRTITRVDRTSRVKTKKQIDRFVLNAYAMFDYLNKLYLSKESVITVDNISLEEKAIDKLWQSMRFKICNFSAAHKSKA